MNPNALEVYLYGNFIGHLINQGPIDWRWQPATETPPAADAAWSLNNLTSTSIKSEGVCAWFRALLPEAGVSARLALKAGLSPGNDFALLAGLGEDCPGALCLRQSGRATSAVACDAPLASDEIRQLLRQLRDGQYGPALGKALWPGDGAVLPLIERGNALALATPGHPSTVLLRATRYGLTDAPANEGFCMQLAEALDLPVVPTRWSAAHGGFLLVGRPDCVADGGGGLVRRQIETFSQLAGLGPEQAFEREGGLALRDCAMLIRRYSMVPALDLRALLRWVGLCLLCGNGLATGNSLRFLFTPSGPRLAPFAEMVASHVYPEMSERLGFYIGREDRPDWLLPARWRELAEEIGVGPRYLLSLLRELALATGPALVAVKQSWQSGHGWSAVLENVAALIEKRARQLWVALEAEQI